MAFETDDFDPAPQASRLWNVFSIPAILAIGWILYEVSQSPGLAAMVMCLKFGFEDFRTAFWLGRRDPWRERGRATRSLYLASGMWKAAMTGIAMVFVILMVIPMVNVQGGNANGANPNQHAMKEILKNEDMLLGAFGVTLFGQMIACLACANAMRLARKHRIPLWLSGTVHIARHKEDWPPLYGFHNRLIWLNATCFLFNWLVFIPILAIFLTNFIRHGMQIPIPRGLLFLIFFIGYLRRAILLANVHASLGIHAQHPAACWGRTPAEVIKRMKSEVDDSQSRA